MHSNVCARTSGSLGHITLQNSSNLNALTLAMIRSIANALHAWERRRDVTRVLIDGAGQRAFCVGGDVKAVYATTTDEAEAAQELWREQHLLNVLIATYRKPVVSYLHGLVLGGGVGLGCHASHRLTTPSVVMGMPEVHLGLAPDVGSLYRLALASDFVGFYLALTGNKCGARGALVSGLADTIVQPDSHKTLLRDLAQGTDVDRAIARLELPYERLPDEDLLDSRGWISECYRVETVEEIMAELDARSQPQAVEAAERMRSASPLAVKVTLHSLLGQLKSPSLLGMFVEDLRRNVNFSYSPDLREGIRAAVIDKDHRPAWSHTLADASDEVVSSFFAAFDGPDLEVESVVQRES